MAQLVEHVVHIDGVTGSSPVATTKEPLEKSRGFTYSATERNTFFDAFLMSYLVFRKKQNVEFLCRLFSKLLVRYFEVNLYFVTVANLHAINQAGEEHVLGLCVDTFITGSPGKQLTNILICCAEILLLSFKHMCCLL